MVESGFDARNISSQAELAEDQPGRQAALHESCTSTPLSDETILEALGCESWHELAETWQTIDKLREETPESLLPHWLAILKGWTRANLRLRAEDQRSKIQLAEGPGGRQAAASSFVPSGCHPCSAPHNFPIAFFSFFCPFGLASIHEYFWK